MNIVQLHERIRFWVDIVSSTRFESEDIDNALNTSIDNKVRESYDQNRPMNRSDAFQRVQRVRDELGPLVVGAESTTGITHSVYDGRIIVSIDDPDTYGFLLALRFGFNGTGDPAAPYSWYPVFPMTYDRKNVTERNPYRRVRSTPQAKCYYIEKAGNIEIDHPFDAALDSAFYRVRLDYLKTPAIVNYGIEYGNSHTFSSGDVVIAVAETFYNGVTYKIGEKFTIVAPFYSVASGGLVVFSFVECDVRSTTHEEIARRAAINCLLTAGEYEKSKALREEIVAL